MEAFLTDAWCGGNTWQERAVLVWESASAWSTRLPGLVVGHERVVPSGLRTALRPAGLVGVSVEVKGTLVARPEGGEGVRNRPRRAGSWLHTLALDAGRVVAVTSWRGTAEGMLTTRELDGKRVGKRFGCKKTSPSEETTVAESELSWIPLLAGEWRLLERGHKVAAEG